MLEMINRYAHGLVAIPSILACRQRGLFRQISRQPGLTRQQLAEALAANEGHLAVVLRLLQSLRWLSVDAQGGIHLQPQAALAQAIPEEILSLLRFPFPAYLQQPLPEGSLAGWIEHSQARWQVPDELLADLLDGLLLAPLLLALHHRRCFAQGEPLFATLHPLARQEVTDLFLAKGWMRSTTEGGTLTPIGQFLVDRILIIGTTASYLPMLLQVDLLLFGDAAAVFARDGRGHERHVDRTLNVVGSGFQHGKFFADIDETVAALFNQPLGEQPDFVVDMGCGDGTLLARVYEVIRTQSARGPLLASHPVLMVGVDYYV